MESRYTDEQIAYALKQAETGRLWPRRWAGWECQSRRLTAGSCLSAALERATAPY